MSSYTTRVLQDSPTHYFAADNGTANQIGSETITLTTGTSLTFPSTGGIKNSGYIQAAGTTAAAGQLKWTDSATIYNDKVFTVSGWFNVATGDVAAGSDARFFSVSASTSSGSELYLALNKDSNNANAYVTARFYNQQISATLPSASVWGKWKHFAFTSDGTNTKLYIDGSLVTTGVVPTSAVSLDSRSKYFFNTDVTGVTTQRRGKWDELTVFNTALTPATILDHYNAYLNASYTAEVGTASGLINDVTVTHDKLNVLVPADGAAYIFPLEANLNQMTGAAMVGKTFGSGTSPGGSVSTINKSVSGGTDSLYATSDFYYQESGTSAFSSLHGITMEVVFQHKQLTNPALIFGKVMNSGYATQIVINKNGSNDVLEVNFRSATNQAYVTSTTPLVDNQWYHVIATWKTPDDSGNANDTVRLYINNVLDAQSGNFTFAANTFDQTPIHGFGLSNQYVDYAAVYSYPYNGAYLNATKRTQHYQAVLDGIDALTNHIETPITAYGSASMPGGLFTKHASVTATALTASGQAVNPYEILITHGQGGPMTATAEIVLPVGLGSVNKAAPVLTAFATSVNPNVTASKNATITATALTASAQMIHSANSHDSGLSASTLYADADIVEPIVFIAGLVRANAMIANASIINPAITTELNAIIKPKTLTAKSKFVTPPEFVLITDDIWYQKLYLQHSVVHGETGYTAGVSSAYAFLKLFNDVETNLNGEVTSKLTNNLPWSIVIDNPDTTTVKETFATASNEFLTATPLPLVEVGTFDDYERKSVRFRNTQFKIAEDIYKADGPYSLEFTFKTTKANQVIAQGLQKSFTGNQSATSSIGLINGKLFASRATQPIGSARVFAHPDNKDLVTMNTAYGNKAIADGQWHHIIIQYGFDGRVQFWIDGQLDIQFFADSIYGRGAKLRPYIIGSNHTNTRWQSDFETSAWSYDAAFFVASGDVTQHYSAAIKYEPIKVEVATATAALPEPVVTGNRGRALMLYFWATSKGQATNASYANFTSNESPEELETLDYYTAPPQYYEGWDVFPIDVTGRFVSDLVNVEAYGAENIQFTTLGGTVDPFAAPQKTLKVNKRRTFRDKLTDAPRYIDLVKDIDLTKFDLIMFKNYPDDPKEKDAFSTNEVVDAYFNMRESAIFEDFLKSLRAAVDTGISLIVTNPQLAIDLKIVDRVEVVPDMDDNIGQGNYSDPYAPTQAPNVGLPTPPEYNEPLGWQDTWKNNRTRIVNTHPGITDYPALVKTQQAFWKSTDEFRFGGPDRPFIRYEHKNAFAVGDEFVISTTGIDGDNNRAGYLAAPFANVKAGKIITAFANTVRKGLTEIVNPYKDYAQSIIIEPGNVLDGRQVGGKIYVNFTENINKVQETASLELISNYWVNYAYDNGAITLSQRDQLLSEDYVTSETPYWTVNGMHILQQTGTSFTLDDGKDGKNQGAIQDRQIKVRKINKNGGLSFVNVLTGGVFFSSTYSWQYPMATFELPSMPTRGFRWLSNREFIDGTVIRPTAMPANAVMPGGNTNIDKNINVNSPAMIANATIVETPINSGNIIRVVLPMTANATIVKPGPNIKANPMTADAGMFINNRANVATADQVVLQLIHVDPILYIREDVIK